MTTLMIEDIPLMEELSDGAARKIVGGIWIEPGPTPAGPYPVEPDGGIGDTPKAISLGDMIKRDLRLSFPSPGDLFRPVFQGEPVPI